MINYILLWSISSHVPLDASSATPACLLQPLRSVECLWCFFSQLVVLVGTTLTKLLFPPQRVVLVLVIQRGQGRNWLHANCWVVPFWKWCTYLHHITSQMFWTFLSFIEIPILLQSNWIAAAILSLKCLRAFHISLSSLQQVNTSLNCFALYIALLSQLFCEHISDNIFKYFMNSCFHSISKRDDCWPKKSQS